LSPDEQDQSKKDSDYRYNKKQDLKKSIQEREKKMEEERKQIEEDKKKLKDTIPSNSTKMKGTNDMQNSEATARLTIYSPLSFAALFN
jgi:hypothetical protein